MRVYYDRDADLSRILDKKIAIVGYGSQGRAHALNLHDSGAKNVAVALKPGSATAKKVEAHGLNVMSVADASAWADVLMVLAPDELQRDIYNAEIAANIRDGAALMFAHGLNVHFNLIEPAPGIDVLMVAPGGAMDLGLAYASTIGGGRSGIMETNFREECETDLFDLVLGAAATGSLEGGGADGILGHEVAHEAAGLDVFQHLLHVRPGGHQPQLIAATCKRQNDPGSLPGRFRID